MEKTSRAVGLTRTRLQLRHEKWVPVHDTQHSTAIGGVGTGERLPTSVRSDLDIVVYDSLTDISRRNTPAEKPPRGTKDGQAVCGDLQRTRTTDGPRDG